MIHSSCYRFIAFIVHISVVEAVDLTARFTLLVDLLLTYNQYLRTFSMAVLHVAKLKYKLINTTMGGASKQKRSLCVDLWIWPW